MSEGLNFTEEATKFAFSIASATYPKIIKNVAKSVTLNQQVMEHNLRSYATRTTKSFGYIRTIVSESESRLLDIYQPTKVRRSSEVYTEEQFYEFLTSKKSAVIRGNAGAGKSLLLKKYYLSLLSSGDTLPILFELRALNVAFSGLMERLHKYSKELMPWMEFEVFESLLKNGKITLLLDGLDEVSHSIRPAVNTDIGVLLNQFPKTKTVITTRYGDRYATPGRVEEFHIEKFSKHQAASLIRALDFAEGPKLRFAAALEDGLYDRSPDLLSNPLLCSIMLLTYRRFADVPAQLHIYYQQAYEVLFSRHDASKDDGSPRELLSGLDVLEMQSVLNYFAAMTYAADMFEFSEVDCLQVISDAIANNNLQAKPIDVKDDLIEAVSILNRDGLELTFVHRSFQEFFCANYIAKASSEVARACIDAVKVRDDTDSVIPMTIALNEGRFEEVWLLPSMKEDYGRYIDDIKNGRHFNVVRDAVPHLLADGDKLTFGLGVDSRSKSFGVYLARMESGADSIVFEAKYLEKLFKLSSGAKISSFVLDQFSNLPFPKNLRESFSRERVVLDMENRTISFVQELPLWEPLAQQIVTMMKVWLDELERRKHDRESSPLDTFRRAARTGTRRLEGDLGGGIGRATREADALEEKT